MAQSSVPLSRPGFSLGRMPIPREHGAWVMLYVPLVIALAGARPFNLGASALLLAATTAAFLGQNAAGLLLKPRPAPGTRAWVAVFAAVLAASGLGLLLGYGLGALLWIAAATAALFGVHAALLKGPVAFRMDRFQWGQLLAVGGLALTAPAGFVAAGGQLTATAWGVWAACVLFFGSGVFNVNMHFAAAKTKGELDGAKRWAASRDTVLYHLLMLGLLAFALPQLPPAVALVAGAGYVPVIARAVSSTWHLSKKVPSLKAVGLRETGFALWFAACVIAALHLLG